MSAANRERREDRGGLMKALVVNNEKGGVGKSTIAVHLAWYFAERGKRVLFLDLDPQSNGTTTLAAHTCDIDAAALFARPVAIPPMASAGIRVLGGGAALRGIVAVDGKIIEQFRSNIEDASRAYDIAVIVSDKGSKPLAVRTISINGRASTPGGQRSASARNAERSI
jgi:chromosome partitioning protein